MVDYLFRAPNELVQHSAYRGSSQRRKGASSHIIHMVWLCLSQWGGLGALLVQIIYNCFCSDLRKVRAQGADSHPPSSMRREGR